MVLSSTFVSSKSSASMKTCALVHPIHAAVSRRARRSSIFRRYANDSSSSGPQWEDGRTWQTIDGQVPDAMFKWPIHKVDKAWLNEYFGEDLGIDGTIADCPQPACPECGMAFTLRDVVKTAVTAQRGLHSTENLKRWLKSARAGNSTAVDTSQKLVDRCDKCGTPTPAAETGSGIGLFGWAGTTGEGGFDWVY